MNLLWRTRFLNLNSDYFNPGPVHLMHTLYVYVQLENFSYIKVTLANLFILFLIFYFIFVTIKIVQKIRHFLILQTKIKVRVRCLHQFRKASFTESGCTLEDTLHAVHTLFFAIHSCKSDYSINKYDVYELPSCSLNDDFPSP